MFGVDFSELMVILVVALVVIGPERMPKVARTMGNLWSRAQRFVNNVKSDISRDMALEDYRKLQQEIQEQANSLGQVLQQGTQGLGQQVQQLNEELQKPAQSLSQAASGESAPAQAAAAGGASRSVPATPAPVKANLCAIVDKAILAKMQLEDAPDFLTLTPAEQESARQLYKQEEKLHTLRNSAYLEVERTEKLAAAEAAKAEAARIKAERVKPETVELEQIADLQQTQALPQPTPANPEQTKFPVD